MKPINDILGVPAENIKTAKLYTKCVGNFNAEVARANLSDVLQALDKQGATHWLHAGTMLGCVREGGFIEHDFDVDVACLINEAALICEAVKDLLTQGFEFLRCYADNALITLVREKVYVDLYLYAFSEDGYYVNYSDVLRAEDLKTTSHNFLGMSVNILSNPERILEEWYGKDWRTPQQGIPAKPNNRRNRE